MVERSADWYKQAERDLKSARMQLEAEFFEWACFIAQQAAEKSVKALYQKFSGEAWGHSVHDLLRGIADKVDVPKNTFESAKGLDRFYVPARYPNGWSSGFPGEYITKKDAKDAISNSKKILRFCKSILAG